LENIKDIKAEDDDRDDLEDGEDDEASTNIDSSSQGSNKKRL
jgi:hypothetical protein